MTVSPLSSPIEASQLFPASECCRQLEIKRENKRHQCELDLKNQLLSPSSPSSLSSLELLIIDRSKYQGDKICANSLMNSKQQQILMQ